MNKHTIIGMAGHIDHGKTAIIRALSGIETDRLKEEIERGITIDIGFAYWKNNVTIIDVPGHERFVRNMIAGVSTVNLFLLVIAADDGIMPQTIEHLEILKFFGVGNGVVALNKSDLVDDDWLSLVREDIDQFLSVHGFNNVPVIPVSAVKGDGISELEMVLMQKIEGLKHVENERPFRLNVDRSFSAKGFGSVVTGTILSSVIKTGDRAEILPAFNETRIKGIQVHQHEVVEAHSGQRAAVNLAGVNKEELPRGVVITEPGLIATASEFLAVITTVSNLKFKLKKHMTVRVHLGTAEYTGKIFWFDDQRSPGASEMLHVRIKVNETAVTAPGDPVLIRSFSPVTTIAGGRVLEINPPKLRRDPKVWDAYFGILKNGGLNDKIKQMFSFSGYRSITNKEIQQAWFERPEKIDDILQKLVKQNALIVFEQKNIRHFISTKKLEEGQYQIIDMLGKELSEKKYKKGLNFKEVFNLAKKMQMSEVFLERVLGRGVNTESIFFNGEVYFTENIKKSREMDVIREKVETRFRRDRFTVPDLPALAKDFNVSLQDAKTISGELVKDGILISINGQFYIHKDSLGDLISFLKQHFEKNDELEVTGLKDFLDSSRKYVIPLIEYCDRAGYTIRKGNNRVKGVFPE
ncbi:MAG: selenocysteine-specific translation elongation factor [Calditrichaceae bacterium]